MSPHFLQTAVVALSALSTLTNAAPFLTKRALTFDYAHEKVRGVNLGGWFVLEPWITPSIFTAAGAGAVDEYTFCQTLGPTEALSRLQAHWNSWIGPGDFSAMAAAGLNHVRIPIGYWAVAPQQGDPYVQGQLAVLDQAIGWAGSVGIKVLIDLHGAPGSQNGFDNSGRKGAIEWQTGNTVPETIDAIRGLAQRYARDTNVVTAIELLNEPLPPTVNLNELKQYYNDGWGTIRDSNPDTVSVIHDAFQGVGYWNGFQTSGFNDVMLDIHAYQIFSPDQVARSPSQHVAAACAEAGQLAGGDKWTIVGEWTGAITDCAQWMNGRNTGARYDGSFPGSSHVGSCAGKSSGTVAALSSDDKSNIGHFIEAQLDAYEAKTGWIYWTWKTEAAPEWDMQAQLAGGLFPNPVTSRRYPGQCSNIIG